MLCSKLLLIRPAAFGFNPETAQSNAFQQSIALSQKDLTSQVLSEFDGVAEALEKAGIEIKIFQDSPNPPKPDAIFPNNWFSTHEGGQLVIYPMQTPNRRAEVNFDLIAKLSIDYPEIIDLRGDFSQALEGTGSLVLDRVNKQAFMTISPRSNIELAQVWAQKIGYHLHAFHAVDEHNQSIYHTNVMMSVADQYVLFGIDSIKSAQEKEELLKVFESLKKEVIELYPKQIQAFAANVLQVQNKAGEPILILSRTAHQALNIKQVKKLERFNELLVVDIPTIEQVGGGGVRCMLAKLA